MFLVGSRYSLAGGLVAEVGRLDWTGRSDGTGRIDNTGRSDNTGRLDGTGRSLRFTRVERGLGNE